MESWQQKLKSLFSALAQDPIDNAFEFMCIENTQEEKASWMLTIEYAIKAAENSDAAVVDIINSGHGYRITKPIEAREYFVELGYIYLKGINNVNNT